MRVIGFPKRWHHGHSLGVGTLAGFAVASYRPWLILAAGVIIGVIATVAALGGWKLARTLLAGFEAWRATSKAKAERLSPQPQPVYSLRSRRVGPSDEIPY